MHLPSRHCRQLERAQPFLTGVQSHSLQLDSLASINPSPRDTTVLLYFRWYPQPNDVPEIYMSPARGLLLFCKPPSVHIDRSDLAALVQAHTAVATTTAVPHPNEYCRAPRFPQAMDRHVDAYHDYVSAIRLNRTKCTYFSCRYCLISDLIACACVHIACGLFASNKRVDQLCGEQGTLRRQLFFKREPVDQRSPGSYNSHPRHSSAHHAAALVEDYEARVLGGPHEDSCCPGQTWTYPAVVGGKTTHTQRARQGKSRALGHLISYLFLLLTGACALRVSLRGGGLSTPFIHANVGQKKKLVIYT